MQCLKVHHAISSLLIHTRFDDVTQLHGWNKFRGLRVDCKDVFLQKFIYMYVKETPITVFIHKTLVTNHTVTIMVNNGGKCIFVVSWGKVDFFIVREEGLFCSQSKYAALVYVWSQQNVQVTFFILETVDHRCQLYEPLGYIYNVQICSV